MSRPTFGVIDQAATLPCLVRRTGERECHGELLDVFTPCAVGADGVAVKAWAVRPERTRVISDEIVRIEPLGADVGAPAGLAAKIAELEARVRALEVGR